MVKIIVSHNITMLYANLCYDCIIFSKTLNLSMFIQSFEHLMKANKVNMGSVLHMPTTLWSYYYGNLGFLTHSGVIEKLPFNKGWQK